MHLHRHYLKGKDETELFEVQRRDIDIIIDRFPILKERLLAVGSAAAVKMIRALQVYMCMYIFIHMYIYIYLYMLLRRRNYSRPAGLYMYVCMFKHVYIYIYINMCMYAYLNM